MHIRSSGGALGCEAVLHWFKSRHGQGVSIGVDDGPRLRRQETFFVLVWEGFKLSSARLMFFLVRSESLSRRVVKAVSRRGRLSF